VYLFTSKICLFDESLCVLSGLQQRSAAYVKLLGSYEGKVGVFCGWWCCF